MFLYSSTHTLGCTTYRVSVPSLAAHELQCARQSCPSIFRINKTATAGALVVIRGGIIFDDDIDKPKLAHDDTRVHTPPLQTIVFNSVLLFILSLL